MNGMKCGMIFVLFFLLCGCTSTTEKRQPLPPLAERAYFYHEIPEFWVLETHLLIHVLEINRRQVQYLSSDDWRRISRPDDIDIENTRAVVASSGTNKLLIRACRNNYIPFCNDKCAKVVLRLEVAAEGLYEIKARVGDDDSEFKIIDVRSGSMAVGPVKVESYCTNVFSQP